MKYAYQARDVENNPHHTSRVATKIENIKLSKIYQNRIKLDFLNRI